MRKIIIAMLFLWFIAVLVVAAEKEHFPGFPVNNDINTIKNDDRKMKPKNKSISVTNNLTERNIHFNNLIAKAKPLLKNIITYEDWSGKKMYSEHLK